jgi:subtilase family serine protease
VFRGKILIAVAALAAIGAGALGGLSPRESHPRLNEADLAASTVSSRLSADTGVIDELFGLAAPASAKPGTMADGAGPSPSASPTAEPITDPLPTGECRTRFGTACYSADQVRRAYNLDDLHRRGITGKGRTIAVVICFHNPHLRKDLATYSKRWGLPPADLEQIRYKGARPFDPNVESEKACAEEGTIDAETIHYVAPDAKIIMLETPNDQLGGTTGMEDLIGGIGWLARNRRLDAVSMSWGAFEENFAEEAGRPGDYHLLTGLRGGLAAAYRRGVTMLVASGNWGPTGPNLKGDALYDRRGVAWPASDPLVTAVGATRLHLDDHGNRIRPDEIWDTQPSSPGGATGAGTSAVFARPSAQDPLRRVVGDRRGTVDLTLNGSAQSREWLFSTVNVLPGQAPGWVRVAGTSIAAPKAAGMVGLAAQVNGGRRLGDIKPSLYAMARRPAQTGIFDLTAGCNTANDVPGFCGSRGFDLPSGVGTVRDAARFVPALAAYSRAADR